jgi:hypothetical protein
MLNIRFTLDLRDNWTFTGTEDGYADAVPIHPSALRILLAEGPAFAANIYYTI